MNGEATTLSLLCFAERSGDTWESLCLNLDIASHGTTADEAIRNLSEAVRLFLESVHELPEADRRRLMSRRAPLREWLRAYAHIIGAGFRAFAGLAADRQQTFTTLSCPA